MSAALLGIFGALALVLAAVGLYGVMAYTVTERTREIGIRLALGAERGQILLLVLKQGLGLVAVGALLGVGAGWLALRMLTNLLYEVSVVDPLTFVAMPMLLFLVALVACYLPARRAMKVDPLVALRCE
jgi:putative ABC transport system permease protein